MIFGIYCVKLCLFGEWQAIIIDDYFECRDMKLDILPPDINRCAYEFVPVDGERHTNAPFAGVRDYQAILYGPVPSRAWGRQPSTVCWTARQEGGPFNDLFDFCRRMDARKVNRRALESLIRAGALDQLGRIELSCWRRSMRRCRPPSATATTGRRARLICSVPAWKRRKCRSMSTYRNGPRTSGCRARRKHSDCTSPAIRSALRRRTGAHYGLHHRRAAPDTRPYHRGRRPGSEFAHHATRRGDRMAFVTLDDRTGRLDLAVFAEFYTRYREPLVKDTLLVVEGQVSVDEYTGGFKMSAEKIYNVDQARGAFSSRLVIEVDAGLAGNGFADELREILGPVARGTCPVYLRYHGAEADAEIALGEEWKISPTGAVIERLGQLAGERNVHLDYR